ncbi:hypothetical protein swp_4463 [Shewanella piezotolerans WP3]|uniref:Uncharacterized protein n=1 Tax=Shewanella piezotolerans (strain WP3 / JCM 13877) TaxID=225849 RepID=B8CTJ7_SHEPW|nr:hypothetical protein swp_4463 [Shewanella piezotolerans WP3]
MLIVYQHQQYLVALFISQLAYSNGMNRLNLKSESLPSPKLTSMGQGEISESKLNSDADGRFAW